tara:strand:- start:1536 stop:1724 length:189 start_codon:yes stop_codon:yes gene_type:complete
LKNNPTKHVFIGIPINNNNIFSIIKNLSLIINTPTQIHWIPINNTHVTLNFLGDILLKKIQR